MFKVRIPVKSSSAKLPPTNNLSEKMWVVVVGSKQKISAADLTKDQ